MTLEKAADNDFDKLSQFSIQTLRKPMAGSPMLDPMNLLFFFERIVELDFIEETKLPETLKAFFDCLVGYALVFSLRADYHEGIELLKAAKHTFTLIDSNLGAFDSKADILTEVFSSKLLTCLTINMNCDN